MTTLTGREGGGFQDSAVVDRESFLKEVQRMSKAASKGQKPAREKKKPAQKTQKGKSPDKKR